MIKDVFSNRIVGYALDERMTTQLAVNALRTAVPRAANRRAWSWSTASADRNVEQGPTAPF